MITFFEKIACLAGKEREDLIWKPSNEGYLDVWIILRCE